MSSLRTVTIAPRAGAKDEPTSVDEAPEQAHVDAEARPGDGVDRYVVQRVIGEGGMGKVLLVRDRNVGRTVALKQLLDGRREQPTARARFEREARLQGQLEHPAIVPVYDVGANAEGDPYFTMKRVRGQSLADVLEQLARGEPTRFSRRKLLTAFSQLCVAAHYAHERGVVHRDIKPGNIMLGPYNEVYLLDWGVAKLKDDPQPSAKPNERESDHELERVDAGLQTGIGNVMGTLATMAPEQALGAEIDARADVYSLGAVLFEILTLQRLHPSGAFDEVVAKIVAGVEARPSVRAPEAQVPPELEELCVKATRVHPGDRLPSALALHEAIEAYLDGDRDLMLRKESAAKHAEAAKVAAAQTTAGDEAMRAGALGEVGKALALDPENKDALGTLVRLLTTPPKTPPADVLRDELALTHRRIRLGGVAAAVVYAYISLNALTTWRLGVHDMPVFVMAHALWAGALLASLITIWRPAYHWLFAAFCCGLGAAAYVTNVYSPYLLVSGLIICQTTLYSFAKPLWMRLGIVGIGVVAWTASVFGDLWGLFKPTVTFTNGNMIFHSSVIDYPESWTRYYLYASMLAMMVLPALVVGALRNAWQRSDDAMRLQAWQLRQLVEGGASELRRAADEDAKS